MGLNRNAELQFRYGRIGHCKQVQLSHTASGVFLGPKTMWECVSDFDCVVNTLPLAFVDATTAASGLRIPADTPTIIGTDDTHTYLSAVVDWDVASGVLQCVQRLPINGNTNI